MPMYIPENCSIHPGTTLSMYCNARPGDDLSAAGHSSCIPHILEDVLTFTARQPLHARTPLCHSSGQCAPSQTWVNSVCCRCRWLAVTTAANAGATVAAGARLCSSCRCTCCINHECQPHHEFSSEAFISRNAGGDYY